MNTILLTIAGVIIILLAAVAIYYQLKLNKYRAQQQVQLVEAESQQKNRREHINKSIQVLAGSIGKDELSATEAAIRISVLLDALEVSSDVKADFNVFYQLRTDTAHIPILEKWKALSAKEKAQFNRERKALESACETAIYDAATRIKGLYF